MVNAIQVGLGSWGYSWAREVLPAVPDFEAVAYVDAVPAALERVQEKLGVPASKCFASLDEAASAVEADLVIAPVRTEAHFPVVSAALEKGYHVLVEKPFASTVAEAKALVELAGARGRILMVSQNYRFYPGPRAAAQFVAEAPMGPVGMVSIDFRRHAPSQGYTYWDFPDPLLGDMSIHHFDLMRMVLGAEAKRASCRTWNPQGSPFVNDPIGTAIIEFGSGVTVSYRGSWMSGGPSTPWAGEWAIDCTDGQMWWTSRNTDHKPPPPDVVAIRDTKGKFARKTLEDVPYTDRQGTLNAICRAIETGTFPDHFSSGADNLNSLALMQACITSAARDGAWVELSEVLG